MDIVLALFAGIIFVLFLILAVYVIKFIFEINNKEL